MAEISHALPTYKGQRNLAYDLFSVGDVCTCVTRLGDVLFSEEGRESVERSFRAAGKTYPRNAMSLGFWTIPPLRKWILKHTPQWSPKIVDPWTSHALFWIDPTYFSEKVAAADDLPASDDPGGDPRIERVANFLSAAFLIGHFPEAHDCNMSVWTDLVENPRAERNIFFVRMKPHLRHLVARVARLARKSRPPKKLCRAILECADEYVRENIRRNQTHPKKEAESMREKETCDLQEVKNHLTRDGCARDIERLSALDPSNVALCFEEGDKISYVDLLHSARLFEFEATVLRSSRQVFLLASPENLKKIIVYRHPLSDLRLENKMHHPLWSPKQDLLAECI